MEDCWASRTHYHWLLTPQFGKAVYEILNHSIALLDVPFKHCTDWQSILSLSKCYTSLFFMLFPLFSHKGGHFFALCCSLKWLTGWIETDRRFGMHQWSKAGLECGAFMVLTLVSCANRKPIPSSVLRIKRGEWFSISILCFHLFFERLAYLLLRSLPELILPSAFSTTHSYCGFKWPR